MAFFCNQSLGQPHTFDRFVIVKRLDSDARGLLKSLENGFGTLDLRCVDRQTEARWVLKGIAGNEP